MGLWVGWLRRTPSGLVAIGVGVPIVLSRVALQGLLGATSPFILSWPATMLAAFIGGFWPAIVVSFVGLAVGQWALTAGGGKPLGPGGMAIFMAFGLVFALAGGLRKRGLARAKADAARLDEMQRRLVNVARLNAMGEIAATLAHELNQPLTAIAGYAGAASRLVDRDAAQLTPVTELLEKIAGQATRAREIVGRIRGHVTQGELVLAPQSLSEMFQEAGAVAIATAGGERQPTLRADFDPTADGVLADRIQVQQVMVNVVRNAVEAMAKSPRREVRIGTRPQPGGLVEVFVADTGPGLPPDLAERLFEPFVSGKADGMGIGLSISRSIVEAHGGEISAGPNPGGGAVFRFTLRRAP
jgi:C4-dicarboxylate-specific signal transduction histidine kinase